MIEPPYKQFKLENGIRLIYKQSLSNVGHIGFLIDAGSRDEKPNEHGLAHFIEHSIFKGTKKRKSYQIINRLEDVGGELDAYTTKEETFIYGGFLIKYFERTLELIHDIVFNSVFPEKEIEKEKEVVIDEINSYKDSPAELIYDEFENILFKNHPLGRDILGTVSSVKKLNVEKINHFIERNYDTEKMVISVIGNIEFEQVKLFVEKTFSDIKKSKAKKTVKKFSPNNQQSVIKNKKTHQAHCIIGNTAFSALSNNRVGLILLNNIIGGPGMNSLLNMSLREKHGIVYNIESSYTFYKDTGIWNIYLGTDHENLDKSLDLVYKILKQKQEKFISSSKLEKSKKQLLGQIAIASENYAEYVFSMAKSTLLFNKISTIDEIAESINKLSKENLLDISNQIFNIDDLSMLIYK